MKSVKYLLLLLVLITTCELKQTLSQNICTQAMICLRDKVSLFIMDVVYVPGTVTVDNQEVK